MCGISAVFHSKDAREDALASLEKIQHRGGNIYEVETFEDVCLGANRLPIVDRESGRQPLHTEDKLIYAAQNGEIFNHKQLRAELQTLGHTFFTESDTEVLAHGFEEWGPEFVKRLDSEMFAFVVFNTKTREWYAARDPLGVKPLYYAQDSEGAYYFASELKQLSGNEEIQTVHEFPQGHYMWKKKLYPYKTFTLKSKELTESEAIARIEREVIEAVRKRVDTDLPIGVFLSGGVDSSLVMEIATRLHPDVTGIILGQEGAPDHDFAVRLCKERGYRYHVVSSHIDYEAELDELLYHVETYEPLIVRQAFANWICSREAQKLGLSIVLVGEGADELFAGYNEFSALPDKDINKGCKLLTENLGKGHLMRVDRAAMRFTVEVRCPFLDTKLVETAFAIPGHLKVKRENHRVTTKYIFRKVAEAFLPEYIAQRYKMPFANGAGMNVGYNYKSGDGALGEIAKKLSVDVTENEARVYSLHTAEEKLYFSHYKKHGYTKLAEGNERIVVKDVLNTLTKTSKKRLVVAEFDKLALYFPVYLAARLGLFEKHGISVDFIATGGDDQTYATLQNNSAQIGLSDPLFAMFKKDGVGYGEIVGELVKGAPLVAVSFDPTCRIETLDDFGRYKVGTFQEYSTTHTLAKKLLPHTPLIPLSYTSIEKALTHRDIDIAIVLYEHAHSLKALGARVVYDISKQVPHHLFTGFTIASTLSQENRAYLASFLASVKDAFRYMKHHKSKSEQLFAELFPALREPKETFDLYTSYWLSSLKVQEVDYLASHNVWKKVYPEVLASHEIPYYRSQTRAEILLDVVNDKSIRREYPYKEDALIELLATSIEHNKPLHLYGFWGAGPKPAGDTHDINTLDHLKAYIARLSEKHPSGVHVTLLLADRHGENNEYSKKNITSYLKDIESFAHERGFKTLYLSALWKKYAITHESVKETLNAKPAGWWGRVAVAKKLEERATKDFNGTDSLLGAQRYYVMRMMEKSMLEQEYPESIFLVYGDSFTQALYPDKPTLYLYTEKQNYSICPWFVSDKVD